MKKLTDKVSFEMIRYANCWEDADVLLKGLNPEENKRFLSIASAGDNSFSLLVSNPELVVAVDVNQNQLFLVELKREAIRKLKYEEVVRFLGFKPCNNRMELYNLIRPNLSAKTQSYWDGHRDQLLNGIIHEGKFERYFQFFADKILPWIHTKKRVAALLAEKTKEEQEKYFNKKWNNWRWRFLFKLFFSKKIMGRYGRDPEFLKQVDVHVGKTIYNKTSVYLKSKSAQRNFILNYNLTGNFGNLLPHYLEPHNYEKVKANLDKIHVFQGFAEDAIAQYGTFDYMNLSNIFEYMSPELFETVAKGLLNGLNSGGKIAYWNLMVTRSIAGSFSKEVKNHEQLSKELSAVDKGFFYQQFHLDQKL
ncbi:DUF3419 family protein [Fluviicola taffensis]|uniref:DUF3419 family protein n=1 Tax=Fluviicola taffensis TaxID=191579 RepID=UPI003137D41B